MAGYPKLNGFFSAYRYFISCCSDRRLATIDFKELLYLMPGSFVVVVIVFTLITVFRVYSNICSTV